MRPRNLLTVLATSLFLSLAACSGAGTTDVPAGGDEAPFGDELKTKTDAAIQAEIAAATKGTIYGGNFGSESDYPFKMVSASLPAGTTTLNTELVREKLAWVVDHDEDADKPMATLHAMSENWNTWKTRAEADGCEADDTECAANKVLYATLARNLRGIRVYYFGSRGSPGQVDGTAVSVIIVGRTPKGNLAGVRTIAIWT